MAAARRARSRRANVPGTPKKRAAPRAAARARAAPLGRRGFEPARIERWTRRIIISCHPKQLDFVLDPGLYVNALVGRGGGKTTGGMFRFVLRMITTPRAKCVYVALTRDSAMELMWEPLKDLVAELGIKARFHETKLVCTFLENGAQLKLVGCDDRKDIEKLRGKPYHEVGIDETASIAFALLDNLIHRIITPRLGDYNGVLWMIGTPGHILRGEFYDSTRHGAVDAKGVPLHRPYAERDKPEYTKYGPWYRWSSHAWTLLDGVAAGLPRLISLWNRALLEKEKNGWSDEHPVWCREYLGRWAADDTENVYKYRAHVEGKPWNQWDPTRVGPLQFAKLPTTFADWAFGFGMDLGHADPFSLQVFAYSPSDTTRTLYHVFEFIQTKMHAHPIAQLLLGEELNHMQPAGVMGVTGWPDAMVADLAGLGDTLLDELRNVYGITIVMAEKGYKYKFPAIELFNGDLIDGRIKVLKGSKLELELQTLQWVTNEYGIVTENKTMANHATDAAIYIRIAIAALFATSFATSTPPPAPKRDKRRDEPAEPTDAGDSDDALLLADGEFTDNGWGDG